MCELKLPRLISDGMILQQKQNCRIWGWDVPGRTVIVSFLGTEYIDVADADGQWQIKLQEAKAGGPYTMKIENNVGEEISVEDIWVGDVFFCSGQSNMELPMDRVKDAYPDEVAECNNSLIRTFKITECADFHGPKKELLTGEWKEAKKETILAFSATAYFFAKAYFEMTNTPVGLINATLGGSRIESWMGRDMLEGYDEYLALANQYADDEFINGQIKKNMDKDAVWHQNLDNADIGLKENWEKCSDIWEASGEVTIPFFFSDTKLKDFIGCVWFYRTFQVPANMAGKDARLWLGTIVDSDIVFVNGVEVGRTEYQYPPRKYNVPGELLTEGENYIVIRVKCEQGQGRFTKGKTYALWNEEGRVELDGIWKCRIGAYCNSMPPTDFVNWKPTGLYNGMTAPCHKYNVAAILWYQGESNAGEWDEYDNLFTRMVSNYRKKWENATLPVYSVQLPNFEIDLDAKNSGWPEFREMQRKSVKIPNTGVVTTIDLGEDNDLHPLNKKDIGYRLALLVVNRSGVLDVECSGPVVNSVSIQQVTAQTGCRVVLSCSHAEEMHAFHKEKGNAIKDFELVDEQGNVYSAEAVITGNTIVICSKTVSAPVQIRYCFSNTPRGGLIYNKAGLPMSPFVLQIE